MNLILLAIAPVVIILIYIYQKDKYEKEPMGLMAACVVGGGLSVIPILILETLLSMPLRFMDGYAHAGWNAFVVAAFSEELFKFIVVMMIAWPKREFNEKMDGIVYAVCVSMGFALVENLMYVLDNGSGTGLIRAFTAVPAHAIMGVSMGYFLGRAKMNPTQGKTLIIMALVSAIVIHGVYDFILMAQLPYLMVIFVAYMIYLCRRAQVLIKRHSDDSPFKS